MNENYKFDAHFLHAMKLINSFIMSFEVSSDND